MTAKATLEGVQCSQQKLDDQIEGVKIYIKNKSKFDGNWRNWCGKKKPVGN